MLPSSSRRSLVPADRRISTIAAHANIDKAAAEVDDKELRMGAFAVPNRISHPPPPPPQRWCQRAQLLVGRRARRMAISVLRGGYRQPLRRKRPDHDAAAAIAGYPRDIVSCSAIREEGATRES